MVNVFSQKLIPVYVHITNRKKVLLLKHINRNYFSDPTNLCVSLFSLKTGVFFK